MVTTGTAVQTTIIEVRQLVSSILGDLGKKRVLSRKLLAGRCLWQAVAHVLRIIGPCCAAELLAVASTQSVLRAPFFHQVLKALVCTAIAT